MANPSSAGADENTRLFSEPPPSSAEVRGNVGSDVPSAAEAFGNGSAPFSLETARTVLLQLRDSVSTAEFLRMINGVTDASTADMNDDASSVCSHTSASSDEEMDATSVSVKEVSDQQKAGAGNAGRVSMSEGEGVASGNAHPSDGHGEWTDAKTKKRKNVSNGSKSSDRSASGLGTSAKKSRVDTGLFLYLKGQEFDVTKEVTRQPVEFARKLTAIAGAVREVKILKDSVRITCHTLKQKATLLQVVDWSGKPVTVSEPWSQAPAGNRSLAGNRRRAFQRGIIFGVSAEVSEYEIQTETKAQIARRVVKWTDREQVKTGSVVLSYPESETLPESVSIGYLRFKVRPYIPQPIRCNQCQAYGHIAAYCRRQVRCVRCGKGHSLDACPIKDDPTKAICVNCKGPHSAAFRGCSKYQEVSKALKVSVTDKLSYRDALTKVKSQTAVIAGDVAGVRSPVTSTPIVAAPPAPRAPPAAPPTTRRELFQTTHETEHVEAQTTADQTERVQRGSATAAEPHTINDKLQTIDRLRNYLKQLTHHFIYTLSILEGHKPAREFVKVRATLTELASMAFGEHGSFPCLTPNCCRK